MKPRPQTRAAQLEHFTDASTGAVVPALHTATTYARGPDYRLMGGAEYTRDDNPTGHPAEALLASLEGGAEALLFSSGMAAATTLVRTLASPGKTVVASRAMYHGLRTWLSEWCPRAGVGLVLVDATDAGAVEAALSERTAVLWVETPANPTWDVVDLEAMAALARARGVPLAVDSTVATPVFTRALAVGARYVMHSATKYLNGHSDVLAGALVTGAVDEDWARVRRARHFEGNVLGPFEAFLLARGMRTLFARVERQSAAAMELAGRLAAHRGVERVLYPGLPAHPGHEVARRQMHGGFGAMLSVIVPGGAPRALEVASRVQVFLRATSLGGVESLIEHRASVEGPGSLAPPGLLRLSVGLEAVEDLWDDLSAALA